MKIVVANEVVMAVERYVAYMKNDVKYSYNDLMRNKDKMLQYVRNFINKVVVVNDNNIPKRYYCGWEDGESTMAWIFNFIILPQQDLAVIYNLNYKHAIEENKEIKPILSLMERMGMKIYKKEIQSKNGKQHYPSLSFLSDLEIKMLNDEAPKTKGMTLSQIIDYYWD